MTNAVSQIVLASASPRRRHMLNALGMAYVVAPADVDERSITYSSARELALKAAYAKACAVEPANPDSIIVAADTIVVLDEIVYGKPDDAADARRMLSELSGRVHQVITGVAVKQAGKSALLDAEATRVHIRELTQDVINTYIATGEPLDKAGAYALQGIGAGLVDRVEGDFFNVVGLPLRKLLSMMSLFLDVSAYERRLREIPADGDGLF